MKKHIIKALIEINRYCENKGYNESCSPCPFDDGSSCMFCQFPAKWDLDQIYTPPRSTAERTCGDG